MSSAVASFLKRAAVTAVVVAYLLFPAFSGSWFDNRIECVYMWSETVKNGLSIAAYFAIGPFIWRRARPDVLSSDGASMLYIFAAVLGLVFASNVLYKCW